MVFCGKPSKGCLNCRKRRIKCDQIQPSCSQCLRAEKDCSGYRDQLDLQFRDENATVVMRTEKKRAKQRVDRTKSRSSSPRRAMISEATSKISPKNHPRPSTTSRSGSPDGGVAMILADVGLSFFFTHYVDAPYETANEEKIVNSSLLWDVSHMNPLLFTTASCIGYAGLANVSKNPDFMIVARNKYAEAIRAIKSWLEIRASKDFKVLFNSVMMLAVFEIINGTTPGTAEGAEGCVSEGRRVHIEGAAALLMINSQRSDAVVMPPLRCQSQFCFIALVNSISSNEPIPQPIREWPQQSFKNLDASEAPAVDLVRICSSVVYLDSFAKSNESIDPEILIAQARELETALENWEAELPSQWSFSTRPVADIGSDIYDGKAHMYTDLWTARTYNHYRWTRIRVNERLFRMLSEKKLDMMQDGHAKEQQKCLSTILRMAEDICCSISFAFSCRFCPNPKDAAAPPISASFVSIFPLASASDALENS
ncbi:hypothetical protein HYFRA_00003401 [Hymenoscyphus fraxineus]|uniref:Zn(2)-C6 fungal-type domain-containing protein n=1 Tax=Hymenoscyphus fraxineus TaxID=746836 RepID=A0A9N9KS90_9HELO|nr:hypothetical protein HYFRA_00003401 [Hymenoscyphus fraxineus]